MFGLCETIDGWTTEALQDDTDRVLFSLTLGRILNLLHNYYYIRYMQYSYTMAR